MARFPKWLGMTLAPVLFAVALFSIQRELAQYRWHDFLAAVEALPATRVVLAVALTIASYLLLTLYDLLGLRYAGRTLPYGRVALTSFTAYVFSYNIGFNVLGGAAVRYRLYSNWGVSPLEIGKVVLFCASTFWLGMAAVAGGTLVAVDPAAVPIPLPTWSLRLLGAGALALVAAYPWCAHASRRPLRVAGAQVSLPSAWIALAQIGLAVTDLLLAVSVLYALFPGSDVGFAAFIGVYLVAIAAALVSHVPGGLGVFETMMLLGLPTAAPEPRLLAMLLAYRIIYYILPFMLGLVAIGVQSLIHWREHLAGAVSAASTVVRAIAPRALTFGAFFGGIVLLASGATPTLRGRLTWLSEILPLGVLELSHFLASVAGAGLLFLARGLQLRLNAAWGATLVLLVSGAIFSLAKGFDFEEATVLLVMAAALAGSRKHFHRRSSLWDQRFSPGWIVAILLVLCGTTWLGLFAYKHVEYSNDLWWTFEFKRDAPRFLRASVGVGAVVAMLGLSRLLRPARTVPDGPGPAEIEQALSIVRTVPVTEPYLVALGDKALLFSASRRSFLMYGVAGRCWVALGDPVGMREEAQELVWDFREWCDAVGAWSVFYQVSPENLPLYLDVGLALFKLGEEARVSLTGFSLAGGARRGLRQNHTRMEREGCTLVVWEPPEVGARMAELKSISDAWLGQKNTREKGFSLGRFAPDYVSRFPAAVVLHRDRPVAFATLWRSGGHEELSVDLMRSSPDAPAGVMEFLFVRLMLLGSAEGYRWFNLGMAPFFGIEQHPLAPLWNRLGALLYQHGEHFYNFQGLRTYKEKFDPVWRPRYLASPGGLALPQVLAQVGSLVSGGVTGLVRK